MPSALNRSGTSIVLINFRVLTSNIDGWGWWLVKPCPVFGHTVAPLPPTPGITPTGSSVSRSKIVNRFSNAGTAGVVAVASRTCVAPRVMYRRRPPPRLRGAGGGARAPPDGIGVDVVRTALAADLRGLEHFVRGRGLREHDWRERCDGRDQQQSQSSHGLFSSVPGGV